MRSWDGPQSARARAFKDAVRQFVTAHVFSHGVGGSVAFTVTEAASGFAVDETSLCAASTFAVHIAERPLGE